MRILGAIVVLAALAGPVLSQSESHEKLAELSWMVGTWRGQWGSPEQPVHDEYVFGFSHEGAFVSYTYTAKAGDAIVASTTGHYGYDSDQKRIVGFSFSRNGSIGRSTLEQRDDGSWLIKGTTTGSTPYKKYEGVMTREGANTMILAMKFFDAPVDSMNVTYRRDVPQPAMIEGKFDRADAPKLSFGLPAEWKVEPSTSRMRLAQYVIPGEKPASCVVYFFGEGGGGGVQANIDRWVGQFKDPMVTKPVQIEVAAGISATFVDVRGTYVAETRPGSGERVSEGDWRMLGAIVDAPGGPLYIKAVGPSATIEPSAAAFRAWVSSFRKSK